MNKLVFILSDDCGTKLVLVANNHKDLEDYLKNNYDWYSIKVNEDLVFIKEREGFATDVATLEWVKHI